MESLILDYCVPIVCLVMLINAVFISNIHMNVSKVLLIFLK